MGWLFLVWFFADFSSNKFPESVNFRDNENFRKHKICVRTLLTIMKTQPCVPWASFKNCLQKLSYLWDKVIRKVELILHDGNPSVAVLFIAWNIFQPLNNVSNKRGREGEVVGTIQTYTLYHTCIHCTLHTYKPSLSVQKNCIRVPSEPSRV